MPESFDRQEFELHPPAWKVALPGGPALPWLTLLRRSQVGQGMEPAELAMLAAAIRLESYQAGALICRQNEHLGRFWIVARGRVRLSIDHRSGNRRLLDDLEPGDHFGEMALLTDSRFPATATALVDTELYSVDQNEFHRLLLGLPRFAANLSRRLGLQVHALASGKPRRWRPKVIALVNSTLRTQGLTRPLVEMLAERGGSLCALTSRSAPWSRTADYRLEVVPPDDGPQRSAMVGRLQQAAGQFDRVILDLTQHGLAQQLPLLLSQCDLVWWVVEPRFAEAAMDNLRDLLAAHPALAPKTHLVWVLRDEERFAAWRPAGLSLAEPDFKVVIDEAAPQTSLAQRQSFARLWRFLQGTRVGLALSGGGARGMAHLGVLHEFDRAGITFDLIAGSSSGALVGAPYAAGWPTSDALLRFKEDLTPPALLRRIPGGNRWYLLAMFRSGAWDGKLRRYFGAARLEQLRIPFSTVTVDLVGGQEVVRHEGDVVHSILESINVPIISRPILRDGMALVDGGVLNNLPADVLRRQGAELVVGVDVGAKLGKHFARRPGSAGEVRRPSTLETILRVNEVQELGVTSARLAAVDYLLAPDTSAFEFADFGQAEELAEVGAAAARAAIPQIQQIIAELERD